MNENIVSPLTHTSMTSSFVESTRSRIFTAIALLGRPSAEVAASIAADLHTIGGEAAMINHPELASVAWEGENAAMQLAGGQKEGLVPCLRALRRLGYLLQETESNDAAPRGSVEKSLARCRILIVDDSQVSAAALAAIFEMHAYDVRVASSRQDAEGFFTSFLPVVLVTDVHMPDIDVADLCRGFRNSAVGRQVAVVLVSGRNEAELRDQLASIQADLFIPKMEGAAAVVARVSSLVQGLVG